MTLLSCHRFRSNEVRLWLSVIAYNLGTSIKCTIFQNKLTKPGIRFRYSDSSSASQPANVFRPREPRRSACKASLVHDDRERRCVRRILSCATNLGWRKIANVFTSADYSSKVGRRPAIS